jgi:tRNA (cytidine/uridine-2'-O-)-methyltransferase
VVHENLDAYIESQKPARLLAFTTKADQLYTDTQFQAGDALIFGPETRGLPTDFLASLPARQRLRLPMLADSRSLNLSNTVAIVVYESWRQSNFTGFQK